MSLNTTQQRHPGTICADPILNLFQSTVFLVSLKELEKNRESNMALIFAPMACRRCVSTTAIRETNYQRRRQAKATLDRMLRVDHAGEYGAVQIYKGQMAVLGRSSVGPIIQVIC